MIGLGLAINRGGLPSLSLNNFGPDNPLYIAHRGGSLMYPEETTEGYAASYAAENRVLEMDVQVLSDGALALMHDDTVDRTTTGTGAVSGFDTAGWRALQADAGMWFGGGWGNNLSVPLFSDVLAAYGNHVILVPEAKSVGSGPALVAAMQGAGISAKRGMVQAFNLADLGDAVAAGYPAMFLAGTSTVDIANAQATGATWVGIDVAAADSVFSDWAQAGFKTAAYTVKRRWMRDYVQALGVSGHFAEDPQYLSRNTPVSTTDNFVAQTWQPGMVGTYNLTAATDRGRFVAPDMWELPINGTSFNSCVQGWACPIKGDPDTTSFTVDFKVTFRTANAGDQSRWASVFLGKNDKPFKDAAAPTVDQQGYHFLLRKNGQIQIYKRTTSESAQMAITNTTAIADDEEVAYRIVMTPATVSLHRLDGTGAIAYTATYASSDASYRGGYMHFGRNGLGAAFRDVSIT